MTKIDIFSGFLGAGKTTLIKKLIKEAYAGEKLVLIENEFGEIGIDGGFLKEAGIEITEMNSGCICCSLVGDFGKALEKVLDEFSPDRIFIEPSGVGKLSDVVRAAENACGERAEIGSLVAVVDANKCRIYIKNFGEFFLDQLENAGTVVLSRTDSLDEAKLSRCVELIRQHNPGATLVTTPWDQLSGDQLRDAIENKNTLAEALERFNAEAHHHHHHDEHEEHSGVHDHCHEHGREQDQENHGHHHHAHGEHCDCGCHDHDHEEHHHDEDCDCGCHDHEHHHHDEHCDCGCHDHDHDHDHDHEHEHEHHHAHDHEGHSGVHDHEEHSGVHDHCHEHSREQNQEHHEHHCHAHGEHSREQNQEHHGHHCHAHGSHAHGDHGHHADEVFTSCGIETGRRYTETELDSILAFFDEGVCGVVLRAKGIVAGADGSWFHFDYVPGERNIRRGSADITGRICVIGSGIDEKSVREIFLA
ncbi:MAG: cobalamin biosynthesis protein CobW [Ruminococcaceae bacterium]|nr:cobalamin biosynthesis protein CobW [Oscillospiraceae bacterium]